MNKTKKKLITTVMLVCCMGILIVGYFYLVQYNKDKAAKKSEETVKKDVDIPLLTYNVDEIGSLSVSSDQLSIVLVKDKTDWIVEGRTGFPLDQSQAEAMVKNIAELSMTRIVTEKAESLSDYGLENPRIKVKATLTDGTEKILLLGEKSSAAFGYYAKMSDSDTIYVLTSSKGAVFDKTETALYQKLELCPTDTTKYLEVQVKSPDENEIHLTNIKDGPEDVSMGLYPWRLTFDETKKIDADLQKVSEYFSKLAAVTECTGVDFGRDVLDTYGLSNAKGLISIRYHGDDAEHVFELHIGDKDENGDYYVCLEGSDVVYRVKASLLDPIFSEEKTALESKFLHLINIKIVSSITTKSEASEHTFTVKPGSEENSSDYFMDDTKFANEDTFKTLYQSIISVSFDKHIPKDTKITGESILKLTFHLTENRTITAEYFPLNEEECAVAMNGEIGFSCKKSTIDDLIKEINSVNTSE